MRYISLVSLLIFFHTCGLSAQTIVPDPGRHDFAGNLGFLSSDWMEGREAGTAGGFMAADFIRSQMMQAGLLPGAGTADNHRFFQDFDIVKYQTVKAGFSIVNQTSKGIFSKHLIHGLDFQLEPGPAGFQTEAPLVFAGYGITAPAVGYDDYRNINAHGCIVVVMDGFPGEHDTVSAGWKKFSGEAAKASCHLETKLKNATDRGALAMILVRPEGSLMEPGAMPANRLMIKSPFDHYPPEDAVYEDDQYVLPGDPGLIPLCRLGKEAIAELFRGSGLDPGVAEKRMAEQAVPITAELKGKQVRMAAETKTEMIRVRNVIGHIRGVDTTQCLVMGAHYDHLGKRGKLIYNGSDDNASGVAGMLALARTWSMSGLTPPCNLIFAAWTAEEKGILGSTWFVNHFDFSKQQIQLNVNFDMISRSALSDTGSNIISIGVLKGTDHLKRLAEVSNGSLDNPLTLDLWETSGGGGSDYRPFAIKNIPVMSFFSGFHNDYHSPGDVYARADLEKMERILKLANRILMNFLTSGKP